MAGAAEMESHGVKNPDSILFDGGKRCNLFVIDYGDHMFSDGKGQDFKVALKAVRDRINEICCSGDMNEVGVVIFFNTVSLIEKTERQPDYYG